MGGNLLSCTLPISRPQKTSKVPVNEPRSGPSFLVFRVPRPTFGEEGGFLTDPTRGQAPPSWGRLHSSRRGSKLVLAFHASWPNTGQHQHVRPPRGHICRPLRGPRTPKGTVPSVTCSCDPRFSIHSLWPSYRSVGPEPRRRTDPEGDSCIWISGTSRLYRRRCWATS